MAMGVLLAACGSGSDAAGGGGHAGTLHLVGACPDHRRAHHRRSHDHHHDGTGTDLHLDRGRRPG